MRGRRWDRPRDAQEAAGTTRRLEFGPTASLEENHRQNQREMLIRALRHGPLTARDLFSLAGPGFSSRLSELRKAGYPIVTKMVGRHGVYVLEEP